MGNFDYWRLREEISVVQATLLIIDLNPIDYPHIMKLAKHERPENFSYIFKELTNAINFNLIKATIRYSRLDQSVDAIRSIRLNPTVNLKSEPCWESTTVTRKDIQLWLKSRGCSTGFFFPDSSDTAFPDYLNPSHENYAPKLAAAVNAWIGVSEDEKLWEFKTPKQAITKWRKDNANLYGLIKSNGKHNDLGIEEISKVVNWRP